MQQDLAMRLCRKAAETLKCSVSVKHNVSYHPLDIDNSNLSPVAATEYDVFFYVNNECDFRSFERWTEAHTFLKQMILTKGANLVQKSDADVI